MDGPNYQCIKCKKHCKSGGTLADLAAPRKERERLEREVIEAAKNHEHVTMSTAPECAKLEARNRLGHAVNALEACESSQQQRKK